PDKNQNYAVYAYDKDNCVSEVKTIYVSLYDSLKILIPNDTFFCKGNFLQLNGLATGGDGSGFNYEWTPYFGLNNPMIKDPVANPDTTTTYTLTITDNCGSPEVSKAMQINVFPIPNINFIADVQEGCVPLTVNLSNNSTLAYNCFINYGTGNLINTCGNAVLEYSNPGAYDVTVIVTSKDGCTNQNTIQDFI